METMTIGQGDLSFKMLQNQNAQPIRRWDNIFLERSNGYLHELNLFVAYFNYIPNLISENKIDCKKANEWFFVNYRDLIKDSHFIKRYFKNSKKAVYDDIFYLLYDDLIVDFDTNCSFVRFLFKKTAIHQVETIIEGIVKFREKKTRHKPSFSLLVSTLRGIETQE